MRQEGKRHSSAVEYRKRLLHSPPAHVKEGMQACLKQLVEGRQVKSKQVYSVICVGTTGDAVGHERLQVVAAVFSCRAA